MRGVKPEQSDRRRMHPQQPRYSAAELEQRATAGLDPIPRDVRELGRELRGGLVAALLREEGVSADVRDQERPDLRLDRARRTISVIGPPWVHPPDYGG